MSPEQVASICNAMAVEHGALAAYNVLQSAVACASFEYARAALHYVRAEAFGRKATIAAHAARGIRDLAQLREYRGPLVF